MAMKSRNYTQTNLIQNGLHAKLKTTQISMWSKAGWLENEKKNEAKLPKCTAALSFNNWIQISIKQRCNKIYVDNEGWACKDDVNTKRTKREMIQNVDD